MHGIVQSQSEPTHILKLLQNVTQQRILLRAIFISLSPEISLYIHSLLSKFDGSFRGGFEDGSRSLPSDNTIKRSPANRAAAFGTKTIRWARDIESFLRETDSMNPRRNAMHRPDSTNSTKSTHFHKQKKTYQLLLHQFPAQLIRHLNLQQRGVHKLPPFPLKHHSQQPIEPRRRQ